MANCKKEIVSFILFLILLMTPFFATGCFIFDDKEDASGYGSASSVLSGIKVNYIKSGLVNNTVVPRNDDEFCERLRQQYLDLSAEILINLSSMYGMGMNITDLESVFRRFSHTYGKVSINSVLKNSNTLIPSDSEDTPSDYNLIQKSSWYWKHGDEFDNIVDYTLAFCNDENLYRMQVALYMVNMGYDIADGYYGGVSDVFSFKGNYADKIENISTYSAIKHTGLLECEIETLAKFIVSVVIGVDMSHYEDNVTLMLKDTLAQMNTDVSELSDTLKYQVVAGLYVKDYSVKDIAPAESEDASVFNMDLGQQYYKSIIFMCKKNLRIDDIYLAFQSAFDLTISVDLRIYSAQAGDFIINERVGDVVVSAGNYDDLEYEQQAEIDVNVEEIVTNKVSDYKNFRIGKFENDVSEGGTYGANLKIATNKFFENTEKEKKLAERYAVTKESTVSPVNISYQRKGLDNDCDFLEIVFTTSAELPFDIGYVFFDFLDEVEL